MEITMSVFEPVHVIYDGQCRFCLRSLKIFSATDLMQVFRFHDAHDEQSIAAAFPELTHADFDNAMFALLYMLYSLTFVSATSLFHPQTFDLRMFRIDSSFGVELSQWFGLLFKSSAWIEEGFRAVYMNMHVSVLLVMGLQIREGWRGRGWHAAEDVTGLKP